nr:hypothetical protein [uncultured Flavobacterium sp.]
MSLKNILTYKFDFLHFSKVAIAEAIYCSTIYFGYAIFSMLFFGEGANSFMYTVTNGLIYLGLIILPPTIFNLYKSLNNYKVGLFSKAKNYILTQIILTIAFVWFAFVFAPVTF